jgi:FlaA1/EpsC-like NDP-sugar epimerase
MPLLLWVSVTPLAFYVRIENRLPEFAEEVLLLTLIGIPLKLAAVLLLGLSNRSWRRVGVRDLHALAVGVIAVSVALAAMGFFVPPGYVIPRSVPFIDGMLALLVLGGARLGVRLLAERSSLPRTTEAPMRRVLIIGAGEAGTICARELLRHPESGRRPVGFLDDDLGKRRQRYLGLSVLGRIQDLPGVVSAHKVDEVLIAMPSQSGDVVRRVVERAHEAGVAHRIIPGFYDLVSGHVAISEIREVDVDDLLRREPVRLVLSEIAETLCDHTVLVTGAGGSIGSEVVRQVARFQPVRILLLGRGENSIYQIEREMMRVYPSVEVVPLITDVRDAVSLRAAFEVYRPNVVFHAAAHKHVPLMEANPEQAVFNNVGGTRNLVDLALEFGVTRFVNISTDKAVNPTSTMGASKRVAELIVHRASQKCASGQAFVSVRFGNVLGSRGSVIPLFKEQILRGGPVTVTHPDMVRYFMTIPEATQLVLQAGSMADNGAVYVLDMGEPVRIADLARDLILLCGKEPGVEIEICFSGMRPGEKLYEELLLAEEGTLTSAHEKIFVARKAGPELGDFESRLELLIKAAALRDHQGLRDAFTALVPTCRFDTPAAEVVSDGDGMRAIGASVGQY